MFLDFYKLREQPFGETPDSRYLYLSATHREALASLAYGIQTGRGFLALVAYPGMGKTTLLFHLLEWLRNSARTVFLFQTQCGSRDLLHYLLADLGIDAQTKGYAWMQERLKEVLITEAEAGRRLVVFIDEAQNLRESVLETVRLLSDFENPRSKLIQIVLAGQPQLADKLARPELAQLRQRMSILTHLHPFTPAETEAYISHRLSLAGSDRRQLFTPEARAMIANSSQGIPRNINNLCFNALTLGFAMRKREVDSTIVEEVANDLDVSLAVRGRRGLRESHAVSPPPGSLRPNGAEVRSPTGDLSGGSPSGREARGEIKEVVSSAGSQSKDGGSPRTPRAVSSTSTTASTVALIALFAVFASGISFLRLQNAQPTVRSSVALPFISRVNGEIAEQPSISGRVAPYIQSPWKAPISEESVPVDGESRGGTARRFQDPAHSILARLGEVVYKARSSSPPYGITGVLHRFERDRFSDVVSSWCHA
jgi:type II secretory pathway predicted ATPase ExeA